MTGVGQNSARHKITSGKKPEVSPEKRNVNFVERNTRRAVQHPAAD
jgi:hypothetical protein